MADNTPTPFKQKKVFRPGVGFKTSDNFRGKTFGARVNTQGPRFNPTSFKQTQHKG